MKLSTEILEEKLKAFFRTMVWMQNESSDLSKLYWAEVNTDATYTGLATSAAATFSTKLTKQEVINALTIAEQVDKYFTNQAQAQADYLLNIQGIRYGNDAYTSPGISVAIEAFGERAVQFCNDLLVVFKDCKDMLNIYFDTEISAAIGAVTGEECPWYHFSKSDLTEGVTAVENLKKLINNEVPVTADHSATVSKWNKII